MSGCIAISRSSSWTPAGWIFDNVLEDVAHELQGRDTELAHLVRDAIEGFEYLNVMSWKGTQVASLLEAVVSSRAERLRRGAAAFARPEFFPGFLEAVDHLIGLLTEDLRARASQPDTRQPPQV